MTGDSRPSEDWWIPRRIELVDGRTRVWTRREFEASDMISSVNRGTASKNG